MSSSVSSAAQNSSPPSSGPVERSIGDKLTAAFKPQHLQVINESVPTGSESHFKVVLVSESFAGQSLISRHRSVHAVLAAELASGVHALSITARTPQQWTQSGGTVSQSPACMGGMKAEAAQATTRKQSQHKLHDSSQ